MESFPRPGGAGLRGVPGARWGSDADAAALAAAGVPAVLLARRTAGGDRVAIVEDRGRIAARVFIRAGSYPESDVLYALAEDERWVYDGWVAEDHRGRGLHARLLQAAVDELGGEGVVRTISAIDQLNRPSRRAAEHRGARTVGSVLTIRVAGVTLSRLAWTGGPPRWRLHRRPRVARPPGSPAAGYSQPRVTSDSAI